jgi:hypothetical protein
MGVAVAVVAATQYINASLHEYLGMYISMTVDLHTLLYRKSMQYMYVCTGIQYLYILYLVGRNEFLIGCHRSSPQLLPFDTPIDS